MNAPAGTYMTLKREMKKTELNLEQLLKIFLMIGFVLNVRLKKNIFSKPIDLLFLCRLKASSAAEEKSLLPKYRRPASQADCQNTPIRANMPRLSISVNFIFLFFFFLANTAPTSQALAEKKSEYQTNIEKSLTVAQTFMKDPNLVWFKKHISKARAIFIIPELEKTGVILIFSGGNGVVLARETATGQWSYPAFYTLGKISPGFQLGTDRSETILMVMTLKGLKALLKPACKLGKDVTIAPGPVGVRPGVESKNSDILFFRRSVGSSSNITTKGAIIAPRDKWNHTFYGKPVAPDDILLRNSVKNEAADNLRQLLSGQ